MTAWRGEVCKRCWRRNVVGFHVDDATWNAVSRGRWNVLCPTCFDEEAEAAGVRYRFGEVHPVSWNMWEERP
jgi:hypothetical protein